jgi:hypothetical protein
MEKDTNTEFKEEETVSFDRELAHLWGIQSLAHGLEEKSLYLLK